MTAKKITAVVVPVSALRTEHSCGVGEFLDIIPLVHLCTATGISMIQLLPVYDTGADSSPYSLVSAFALNPLYLSLSALPGSECQKEEITLLKKTSDGDARFTYRKIAETKIKIAKAIFDHSFDIIKTELENKASEISMWVKNNEWVKSYISYKNSKAQNFQKSWPQWSDMKTPTMQELDAVWKNPEWQDAITFQLWLQFQLHKQFMQAVAMCRENGVLLKGDVPIMMACDSADVWANPQLFRFDLTAGTPPGAGDDPGQNWGFPIYFWENHAESGYRWWKLRLEKINQYYDAYRIDHLPGFFRMWAIPKGEHTACLGTWIPSLPITAEQLHNSGFSDERIRWMSEPHIPTSLVMDANGGDYLNSCGQLELVAHRIENQELWLFNKNITCEQDICDAGLKPEVEAVLRKKWVDRLLIRLPRSYCVNNKTVYSIAWKYKDSTAWHSFSEAERKAFEKIADRWNTQNEALWKKHATTILTEITKGISAKPYAEDLGAIPVCVPAVLKKLGIASLKVIRWQRRWEEKEKPFIPLADYPALALTTTATHDTSTLKAWWNTELTTAERSDFLEALGLAPELAAVSLSSKLAALMLKAIHGTPSRTVAFTVQDLLLLRQDTTSGKAKKKTAGTKDTDAEGRDTDRINVPGTVSDTNWTYRMPVTVEELSRDARFIQAVKQVLGISEA